MKTLKLLVIGDCNVGKTSVISTYINKKAADISKTIGLDIFQCTNINAKYDTVLYFYDISGHSRFSHIVQQYIKDIDGIIIIYDITDRDTFNNLNYWIQFVDKLFGRSTNNIPVMILGNKFDQYNLRSISYHDAEKIALKMNCIYEETTINNYVDLANKINKFITIILRKDSCDFNISTNNDTNKKNKNCVIY